MALSKKEKNFLTALLVLVAFFAVIIAFFHFSSKKAVIKKPVHKKILLIDQKKEIRKIELHRLRDEIQEKRRKLKRDICKIVAIEIFARNRVSSVFNVTRRILCYMLVLLVIVSILFERSTGIELDNVLRWMNVTALVLILLFFGTSEENDSLSKSYHRGKISTVKITLSLTVWYLKKVKKEHLPVKSETTNELNVLTKELEPIMAELKSFK